MSRGLWALLLAAAVPAQVVRLANHNEWPIDQWVRTTIDRSPPHAAGKVGNVRYVVGRQAGRALWVVDLHVELAAGEERTVDLGAATAAPFQLGGLPGDILGHFGGWPTVGGTPMEIVALAGDGAAYVATLRCRIGPLLEARLWLRFYPDQPGLVLGELMLTASNPTVPDMKQAVGPDGLRLVWGDAWTWVVGAGFGAAAVPGGTSFADGQARGIPIVLGWRRHWTAEAHVRAFASAAGQSACAVGLDRLHPQGNPVVPGGLAGDVWVREHLARCQQLLHSWDAPVLGVTPLSTVTGSQEDQVWVRGEAFAPRGVAAEQVAYLVGLKQLQRPCHHLDLEGRQRDPATTAPVMFWHSRPHPATGNLWGKPRPLVPEDASGWLGPDREHWLVGSLTAGYRLTGSPMLQQEVRQQALIFLWQETVPSERPGYSTNGADAARAVFWAALLVQALHENLEDRALAARVLERAKKRVLEVYLPTWSGKVGDVWDPRLDGRLTLGPGVVGFLAWQQAVGAYGLDLLGKLTGVAEARELARRGAQAVLDIAWQQTPGGWIGWDNVAVPAPAQLIEGETAHRTGWFDGTWFVPGLRVLLDAGPNPKAESIWAQVRPHAVPSWIPPGG